MSVAAVFCYSIISGPARGIKNCRRAIYLPILTSFSKENVRLISLLIAVIYISFIGLGLPDSLLGSAWPVMREQFGVPEGWASIISIIIGMGTILSSLMSDRLTSRFGAGVVTAVSIAVTAAALFLFSVSTEFWMLALFAVPYGLGAGGVDAALNNYVALNLKSRHMSWLHCMWGVGASVSPYIMGFALAGGDGWNGGYLIVGIVQSAITLFVALSLPLWKKCARPVARAEGGEASPRRPLGFGQVFAIRGAATYFICFFCYCAVEQTSMLWASSYMIAHNGFSKELASMFGSLFFIGITAGRALNGFLTIKFSDKLLIRCGSALIVVGVALTAVPAGWATAAGFVLTGLGCAPVYPCIIHSTPALFGAENSQAVVGMEMAFAYIGGLASPLFGALLGAMPITILPAYVGVFLVLMIVMHEISVKLAKR